MASNDRVRRGLTDDPGDPDSYSLAISSGQPAPPSVPHPVAPQISIADIPLITAPGRRPLLDLFPVFPSPGSPAADGFGVNAGAAGTALPPIGSGGPSHDDAHTPTIAAAPHLTWELFYGLNENPFAALPDIRFLYHSAAHDRVAQDLLSAVTRRDPFAVVVAPRGMGKTMLCRAVIEQLDHRTLTSFVTQPPASIEELFQTVLVDFGVTRREDLSRGELVNASRSDLAAALRNFLLSIAALQAFAVVVIDDADRLSREVLAQLPLLSDCGTDAEGEGIRLLQIVLAGEPPLHTALQARALSAINRGAPVRATLGPLASDEVAEYVLHRVVTAGAGTRVDFDDAAIARIYELSGGIPGTVNALCAAALVEGHRLSMSTVDEPMVNAAAADLEIGAPGSWRATFIRQRVVPVITLALLSLAGAAIAAYAFRGDIRDIVTRWEARPTPPEPPHSRVPAGVAPAIVPSLDGLEPTSPPSP
jgi:type II secretory pathway predicted ATPase ExeA